jgi:hypothetical protein
MRVVTALPIFLRPGKAHCRSLGFAPPDFPWTPVGVDGLHAALFTESRTRGRRQQREVGNPGRDDKGRAVTT